MLNLKTLNLTVLLVAVLVLAPTIQIALAQTPSTFWITSGVYPNPATYTIWKEGSYYYVKDAYGKIPSWSGSTNASYVIQTSLDQGNGITVTCLEGIYTYSTALYLHGSYKTLRFVSGTHINYIGSDSAIIMEGDFNVFEFDEMYSTGATANYGIRDIGNRWCRIKGNSMGTTAVSNASRFKEANIFFDADNAVIAGSGGNLYDISFINHGIDGVRLNSASGITYEGNKFWIRVIMRTTVYGLKIGSSPSYETVNFNSFYVDVDSQGITTELISFRNDKNFVVLEHWNTATGSYEVIFDAGAKNNTLIWGAGAGSTIRILDSEGYNVVIPEV